jgi:hypothetical protein
MDPRCGFDMIYGVGNKPRRLFIRNYLVLHVANMRGWQIICSSEMEYSLEYFLYKTCA